ncbi:MAG: TAXI family TRAP transporter solute-binding subunit [Rubripirellula sp.]
MKKLLTFITLSAAILAAYMAMIWSETPAPPSITIVTGSPSEAYYEFALSMQETLAEGGLSANVIPTAGSIQNAELIEEGGGMVIGFVQGGIGDLQNSENLIGLASVFYEPIWVFYNIDRIRNQQAQNQESNSTRRQADLEQLAGKKIAIGPEGSGNLFISKQILDKAGLTADSNQTELIQLQPEQAASMLERGEVDAAFFVSGLQSDLIQQLLHSPKLRLVSFDRHLAYINELRFLRSIHIPEGLLDLTANIPPSPVTLLSPTANLIAHRNCHPAVVERVLAAAEIACRGHGKLEEDDEFPSKSGLRNIEMDPTAERLLDTGSNAMSALLPYWVLNFLNRLKVFVFTFIPTILLITKGIPLIVDQLASRKVYKYYSRLYVLEHRTYKKESIESILDELEQLRQEVAKMKTTMRYRKDIYNLRLHINLVRSDLIQSEQTRAENEDD